jgi:hypothetical protein
LALWDKVNVGQVLKKALRHEEYPSVILNLESRRRSVISFTPQPFCPLGESFQYPMDRRGEMYIELFTGFKHRVLMEKYGNS